MSREYESTVIRSRAASESLRTTIPAFVAGVLELEVGDSLVWTVEPRTGVVKLVRKRSR